MLGKQKKLHNTRDKDLLPTKREVERMRKDEERVEVFEGKKVRETWRVNRASDQTDST